MNVQPPDAFLRCYLEEDPKWIEFLSVLKVRAPCHTDHNCFFILLSYFIFCFATYYSIFCSCLFQDYHNFVFSDSFPHLICYLSSLLLPPLLSPLPSSLSSSPLLTLLFFLSPPPLLSPLLLDCYCCSAELCLRSEGT